MARYELVDGSSSKFWEIEQSGASYTVTYGRIGTNGQTKTKDFADVAAATTAYDKVVKSKTKKGYALVGSAPAPAAAPKVVTPPKKAAPKAKAAPKQAAPSPPEQAPPPTAPAESPAEIDQATLDALWALALPCRARSVGTTDHFLDSSWIQGHVEAMHKRVTEDPSTAVDELFAHKFQIRRVVGALAMLQALSAVDDATYEPACANLQARLDQGIAQWKNEPKLRQHTAMAVIALGSSTGAAQLLERVRTVQGSEPGGWHHSPFHTALSFLDDPSHLDDLFSRDVDQLLHIDPVTLLTRAGPAVLPHVITALEAIEAKRRDLETESMDRFIGRAHLLLAHVPTAEGVRTLLLRGEARAVTPLWPTLWDKRPDVLLAESLRRMARTERYSVAHDLARRALRIDPRLASVARTDTEKALVEAMAAPTSGTPANLPEHLAAPPWKGLKVPKVATIDGLVPQLCDEEMVWPTGTKTTWATGYIDPYYTSTWSRRYLSGRRKGPPMDDDALVASYLQYVPTLEKWNLQYFRSEGIQAMCVQSPGLAKTLIDATHPCFWTMSGRMAQQLVSHIGLDALDTFLVRGGLQEPAEGVVGPPQKVNGTISALAACLPLRTVRLAPIVAEGLAGKQGNKEARRWVRAHPEAAAKGLVPLALGKAAKPARGARAGLRQLVAAGHRDVVEAAAAAHGEVVLGAITTLLDASPLALKRAPKTPKWLPVGQLEPVCLVGGTPIGTAAQEVLVGMLMSSTLDEPYPALEDVAKACDSDSLADFAWSLFRAWAWEGGPSKDRWAFTALAHLANDEVVRRLADLMALWPSDGLSARAKVGVEVLGAIGGDAALMALYQFSEKSKTKGLKAAATAKMHELAEALGLTTDELADRLVPDLGLDEAGTMALDLGDRTLTVGFDQELRPFIRGEDGKPMEKFPRASATIDKAKLKEARAAFKALQKEAKKVAEHVIARFEGAMATGRSWPVDIARSCFFTHPLMRHLSTRVAWVASVNDTIVAVFRVAEDATYSDADDEPVTLPDDAVVTLLHPLRSDPATVGALGELFADYEVLQPFEQLARPTYALTADERGDTLDRFKGVKVPTKRIFSLEKRGWARSLGQNTKPLPSGSVTVDYRPGIDGGPHADHSAEQTLGLVKLVGTRLEALDAVAVSELLYDIERLREAP